MSRKRAASSSSDIRTWSRRFADDESTARPCIRIYHYAQLPDPVRVRVEKGDDVVDFEAAAEWVFVGMFDVDPRESAEIARILMRCHGAGTYRIDAFPDGFPGRPEWFATVELEPNGETREETKRVLQRKKSLQSKRRQRDARRRGDLSGARARGT